ncbi:hypothetical protein OIU85_007202 [Salix viminalis]|uniref:peroxidase n=1 Tax=Salix viminalis TaxID=40686 RepID=A0A9Q0P934_SALVM|nr:hypothetical protein OIU85_007202 [Salix viminalis]
MGSTEGKLQMGFYSKSCPNAEKIVQDYVNSHIHNAPSLAASILRMHFHDCFVRGCDSSVLLNTTSGTNQTEKLAVPNSTLRGFDFIDRVKSLLEAACPGVVSCADVIALVARDGVVATGGPFWRVPTGRRDGLISKSSEALSKVPSPFDNFTTLQTLFANQGLDLKDLVLLSDISLSPALKASLHFAIAIQARKLRGEIDHIFVCVLKPDSLPPAFNIMTGIHVDEDKAVSWDVVENPENPVLPACKPPIPCLKKVKIEQQNFGFHG